MNQELPFEKGPHIDPFKKPDHKNPYTKNLLHEVLIGTKVNKPRESSMAGKKLEKKPIFEKRKEGLTRSELRAELKKVPYDKAKMYQKERIGLEKEMEWKKYGQNISTKDVSLHIKRLKKEESLSSHIKDKLTAKNKRVLLQKIREKKI